MALMIILIVFFLKNLYTVLYEMVVCGCAYGGSGDWVVDFG